MEVLNSLSPSDDFVPAMATVSSDGAVLWIRIGNLHALCRFSRLVSFPFDQLHCPLDFGGWNLDFNYQSLIKLTPEGCHLTANEADNDAMRSTYQASSRSWP